MVEWSGLDVYIKYAWVLVSFGSVRKADWVLRSG